MRIVRSRSAVPIGCTVSRCDIASVAGASLIGPARRMRTSPRPSLPTMRSTATGASAMSPATRSIIIFTPARLCVGLSVRNPGEERRASDRKRSWRQAGLRDRARATGAPIYRRKPVRALNRPRSGGPLRKRGEAIPRLISERFTSSQDEAAQVPSTCPAITRASPSVVRRRSRRSQTCSMRRPKTRVTSARAAPAIRTPRRRARRRCRARRKSRRSRRWSVHARCGRRDRAG